MKIFALDPSINDVGWAVAENITRNEDGVWDCSKINWRWGHWNIGSINLVNKFREIAEWVILEVGGLDPTEDWIVLEWPAYFGTEKGQIAAQMGYTLPLAGVCAYVAGFFRMPPDSTFFLTATEWKGSVPKEITRMRFFRALGIEKIYKINHNAVDAVMLLHTFCKRKKIVFKITTTNVELLGEE
jgi:hypothetical protein